MITEKRKEVKVNLRMGDEIRVIRCQEIVLLDGVIATGSWVDGWTVWPGWSLVSSEKLAAA